MRSLVEARARRPQPPPTALALAPIPAVVAVAPAGGRTSSRARSALFAGGIAAVLAISLLIGVRVDVGGQPAGADSTIGQGAPKSSAHAPPQRAAAKKAGRPAARSRTKAPAHKRAAATTPTRHRFAWAPTKGASGYEVEFFVKGARVYAGHTTAPTIEIPAHWQYEGAQHSFHAGEYGWYVWPEVGGKRSSQASVQSTISIARG